MSFQRAQSRYLIGTQSGNGSGNDDDESVLHATYVQPSLNYHGSIRTLVATSRRQSAPQWPVLSPRGSPMRDRLPRYLTAPSTNNAPTATGLPITPSILSIRRRLSTVEQQLHDLTGACLGRGGGGGKNRQRRVRQSPRANLLVSPNSVSPNTASSGAPSTFRLSCP